MKETLWVQGMHGLGDNLHQRALLRQWMRTRQVWLETPWPSVYHDLVGPDLHLVSKGSRLRTQAKNAARESEAFEDLPPEVTYGEAITVSYPPFLVQQSGTVLRAMARNCGLDVGDFRMPVPDEWLAKVDDLIKQWRPNKPIMFYRPLMERSEWSGTRARNPRHDHYVDLFNSIRDKYFVVSVADLEEGKEWTVGPQISADVTLHHGELDFQNLAALIKRSALVFTSPGFAVILAQAVETPVVAVFGGYENSKSFREGAKWSPYLGIDPIVPCNDFAHHEMHDKSIDMPSALARLARFARGGLATVDLPKPEINWASLPKEYCNPGEMEALVGLANEVKAQTIVEIGCNTGRTSKLLMLNVPTLEFVVGVDVPPGTPINQAQKNEIPDNPGYFALDDPRFTLLIRPRGSYDLNPEEMPKADLVFIDGDHSRDAVINDTILAMQILKPGGAIVWHDYHWQGNVEVQPVLDQMRAEGRDIRHVRDTWLAVERFPWPDASDGRFHVEQSKRDKR